MKRSVLALLLTAVLCIPMTAYASAQDNGYAQEIVALLEDRQYAGVITIQEDVEIKIESRYICDVYGDEGQEKVLDLNGHTVTICHRLDNCANLLLTDSVGGGKLILTSTLTNQGTLTISEVNVVRESDRAGGTAICNRWPGTFHLVSGTIDATQVQYAIENQGGVCVIEDGVICGWETAITSGTGTRLYGVSGQDADGHWYGTTGCDWYDGALTINGGLIEGDLVLHETDVTITGGVIRGQIEIVRYAEYKDGEPIELETPLEMQYYNTAGDAVTLPKPTYALHEDNGEMKRGYLDVSTDDWFYAPVQTLMDNGVLDYGEGRDKGSFGPAEPLTRGQAAALLLRACGAEIEEETEEPLFWDVAKSTPYSKYINTGKRLGLLSGDGQKRFHPEDTITRQEFAVLVMNAVHKNGLELPSERQSVSFRDADSIASWAKDAVAEGVCYGLWNGTGSGDFLPQSPITRAEGVTILARLMEHMDI